MDPMPHLVEPENVSKKPCGRTPRRAPYHSMKAGIWLLAVMIGLLAFTAYVVTTARKIKIVRLADIPGISSDVLRAQGKLVEIEDPVTCLAEPNTYLFTIAIVSARNFSQATNYEFAGDAQRLDHFVREVKFVNEGHGGMGESSAGVLRGATDDIWGMVKGLANMVFHPIDTAVALEQAGEKAIQYMKKVYKGDADMRADALEFANSYTENVYMAEAARFDLNYQELQTPEAAGGMRSLGHSKIVGTVGTELLLVYFGWTKAAKAGEAGQTASRLDKAGGLGRVGSKAGEAAETGKLTHVGKWGSFFPFGEKAESGAARTAQFAAATRKMSNLERLANLLSPAKIPSGEHALSSRLHKVLYWLNQEEAAGKNASEALTRAMKMAEADKRIPEKFLDPKLDHAQIIHNYDTAKRLQIFGDPANLERMRRGKPPSVAPGPFAGPVEVDHIVPFSRAPELDNVWGNLRYADRTFNMERGPKARQPFLDEAMAKKLIQYRDVGMLPQSRIDEILKSSTKMSPGV